MTPHQKKLISFKTILALCQMNPEQQMNVEK